MARNGWQGCGKNCNKVYQGCPRILANAWFGELRRALEDIATGFGGGFGRIQVDSFSTTRYPTVS